jgi:hypothetical protein
MRGKIIHDIMEGKRNDCRLEEIFGKGERRHSSEVKLIFENLSFEKTKSDSGE